MTANRRRRDELDCGPSRRPQARRTAQHAAASVCFVLAASCSRPSGEGRPDAAPASPPAMGFGTAMSDVARRFEIFGRAATAGRWELAGYELQELEELFGETLPQIPPPKEGHPEVVPALIKTFVDATLPDLRRALATREKAQITAAFARASASCNACHEASGHGYIEVPSVPGRTIPNTDPPPAQ